eukprot:5257623-Prorocentrum_lima.AAC.1
MCIRDRGRTTCTPLTFGWLRRAEGIRVARGCTGCGTAPRSRRATRGAKAALWPVVSPASCAGPILLASS